MVNQSFQTPDQGIHRRISLPHGQRIYAIGDIHGELALLEQLQSMIAADIKASPAYTNTVIYLGDYVDRGPDSCAVVENLSTHRLEKAQHIFLKGNHEALLIDFMDNAETADIWLLNGGATTLKSYGIDPPSGANAQTFQTICDTLGAIMPAHHKDFLSQLQLSHRTGSLFFAHAGVNPSYPLNAQRDEDLMWIRDKFLYHQGDLGAIVVHGHTPGPVPEVTAHRINIDTHAYYSGHLCAAVFENGRLRFLNT